MDQVRRLLIVYYPQPLTLLLSDRCRGKENSVQDLANLNRRATIITFFFCKLVPKRSSFYSVLVVSFLRLPIRYKRNSSGDILLNDRHYMVRRIRTNGIGVASKRVCKSKSSTAFFTDRIYMIQQIQGLTQLLLRTDQWRLIGVQTGYNEMVLVLLRERRKWRD
jgi:hypothetical protein